MEDSKTSIVSPVNYAKIFFRRKFIFLIPLFAGLIFGICAGILMPKEFQSSSIILVEEGKTDNPLFTNIAVSTTVTQCMNTIRESMLGWNSLVTLVKRLNLDKDIKSTYQFEQLVLSIRNSIHIKMRGPNIIDLAYVGKDPQTTQAIVKNVVDIFIERNMQLQDQETADAIKFIEEQLKVYKGKIKSAEIAGLQERLNALLLDSTEKHPLVKQIREQINMKKEELQKEKLEFTDSESLKTQTTNPIIDEIKKALGKIQSDDTSSAKQPTKVESEVAKVVLLDKLDNVMARDVQVNEGIYNMLLQRLETAKITQRLQASKEGTKYTVLDPPRLPLKPFKPNKPLLTFLGLLIGGIAGICFVVLSEFLDRSFLDVEEAKEYLGMPLLGAISKITTIESIQEERERNKWAIGLTLLAGVVVVIIVLAVSTLSK